MSETYTITDELLEKGGYLDQLYIPTRYPNGFPEGAPMEFYSKKDAEYAVQSAEEIIRFCQDKIS